MSRSKGLYKPYIDEKDGRGAYTQIALSWLQLCIPSSSFSKHKPEAMLIIFFILILTSIPISSPSRIYPHHKPTSHALSLNQSAGFSLPIYHVSHPKVQTRPFAFSPLFSANKNKFVMVVTLGNPEVSNLLILDTGSDICWMLEGEYSRSESLSFRGINCKDDIRCTEKVPNPACSLQGNCYFSLEYHDGRTIAGDFVSETFCLYDRPAEHDVPTVEFNMSFGLVNPYGFDDFPDGVLGMNFGSLGLLAALKVDKFSVCFPDPIRSSIFASSFVRFGDDALLTGECTSLSAYVYHLVFFVESIKIADVSFSKISGFPSGAYFTFDTGAEQSYLHPLAMNAVVEALRKNIKDEELFSPGHELCYKEGNGSSSRSVEFSFQLKGGGTLRMDSTNLWETVGEKGNKYCLAMQRSKSDTIIFGMTQIWGKNYGFDWTNHKLCFQNRDCALA